MLKVLIVDDKLSVCRGLRKMIPWESVRAEMICECRNGKEALEMTLAHQPDVIITDIRMPVMDGLELCKQIHEHAAGTVIIILSAFHDFTYAQTAMQFGVIDYILKPIDRPKIVQLTEKIAEIAQAREIKQLYHQIFYDTNLKVQAAASLKIGDLTPLELLFESVIQKIEVLQADNLKNICIQLYITLVESIKEIGLSLDYCKIIPQNTFEELLMTKSKQEMITFVQSLYNETVRMIHQKKGNHTDAIIDYVKSMIQNQLHDANLSLNKIANDLNLSPSYISVIFRNSSGENISTYITRTRLEKAQCLLKNAHLSIYDIANKLGYIDSNYFAKVFKQKYDITPSQYRSRSLLDIHSTRK